MTVQNTFYIDGKQQTLVQESESVAQLLQRANVSCEQASLVTSDGVEHSSPQEMIAIASGSQFTTRAHEDSSGHVVSRPNQFKVNGEVCYTSDSALTVRMILQSAGANAGIDQTDLGHYFLQRLNDETKFENLDDQVTISDGDEFLAIHTGDTPVA